MRKLHCLTFLASLVFATSSVFPTRQNDPTQIQTSSGVVKGHPAVWPKNTTVVEFLGVPYAQPPLGNLRFAAPKALQADSSKAFTADKYSQDCLQFTGSAGDIRDTTPALRAYGFAMGGGSAEEPHQYGEDCLTANVWMKPTGQTEKAVMVWIYGGAFSTGTSNAPFYNGARLAEDEDVVVVSFNYRVTIFGFPSAPGLPDQNVALLDQRLAVEWVRDNIAGFGGDPTRITLFGESAGGASVDLYSYAWTADPIVNGFIAQSGSSSLSSRAAVNTSAWFNISSALGCGGEEAGDQTVQCMRGKNATDIINAVGQQTGGAVLSGFGPASDGKLVFADTAERSAAGKFIKRPILIGHNDFEVGIIRGLGPSNPLSFGGLSPNASDQIVQAATEIAFGCPAAKVAQDRISNGIPAWRYRYMAIWDNVALAPTTGAYHSSEIPIALGTNPLRPNATTDVPEQAALEKLMVHAWAEFAKDPDKGLTRLNWPTYNTGGNTLIRLGFQNKSALNLGPATQYDSLCSMNSANPPTPTSSATPSGSATNVVNSAVATALQVRRADVLVLTGLVAAVALVL